MKGKTYRGYITTNSKGFGFFSNEDLEEDIFIQPGKLLMALNGDEVEIKIIDKNESGPLGEVTKVLDRAHSKYVGTVDKSSGRIFVISDDRKAYVDFFVPERFQGEAEDGDKVVVELVDWKDEDKNPIGKIVSVLGKKGENDAEMKSIIISSGFDGDFPPEVEEEAEKISKERGPITEKDVQEREDFRDVTTITIDPASAKDFDDAISFRKLDDDNYEVGVHIADVSHFVDFGSKIDKEAFERGFSVYLVDRTIPMLPEVLSNDLCSLNPGQDKHAFSAIMVLDKKGNIIDHHFSKTLVHSNRRFTYEEAQAAIDGGEDEFSHDLSVLNTIAKELKKKNQEGGAIEFETDEVSFELAPDGTPIKVTRKERLDVHKLVEEYMLLANRMVAKKLSRAVENDEADLAVYRVHDTPQVERVENFAELVRALGYKLPLTEEGTVKSKDLSEFLEKLEGRPEESLLKTAAIRSMAKASYSTDNIGHYGLSFNYYTHFTSPIRRYADLVVHRILNSYLKSGEIPETEAQFYFDMISHITDREQAAVEAERASKKYKHVEYMQNHIGEEFEGTISGVSEWGIYVEEKETMAEGMISTKSLGEDCVYEKEKYRVSCPSLKRVFSLGDSIKFRIKDADLDKKQLNYELVE
ncbi:MAG: ribonuclease R [Candidatus Campbellbacteria bacterium]|nr:ribonuclease R [Candidatus Campbellbacteria bacterium]